MKFSYQARDQKGNIITGIVEASSKDAAIKILEKKGFFVTILEEAEKVVVW